MRFTFGQVGSLLSLAVFVVVVGGCNQANSKSDQAKDKGAKNKPAPVAQVKKEDKKEHDHSGWWCDEHGVPEAECSMCSAKVEAECKKKGDWCEKHNRAKSQCFLCDPSLKDRFAAIYRAREGKEPPVPEENMPKKDDR
jgi:hypothetical protein